VKRGLLLSLTMTWTPWQFMMVAIAGCMNRQQQEAIAYLKVENRILREKLGQKHILLDVWQKRRLPASAAPMPRALLRDVGTLFSPDTLIRWHRWSRPQVLRRGPLRQAGGARPNSG